MDIPDLIGAETALKQADPNASLRFIPWPKDNPDYGKFDIYEGGYRRCIINKDFKDIKRLTQYFDWFYSDEGLDIITWGPESAGLWEMKDGKKVFKDKETEQDCLNGISGKKGADYYGLYDSKAYGYPFSSKAAMCAPVMSNYNPKSYTRSYPAKLDLGLIAKNMFGSAGVDNGGRYSYGDGGPNVSACSSWYWSTFVSDKVAKLLVTKSDADFDKAWDEVYNLFLKDGKYEEAKADMQKWFNANTSK